MIKMDGKQITKLVLKASDGSSVTKNLVEETTSNYQEKTVTTNGTVLPDDGYDALSKVIVNVAGGAESGNFKHFTKVFSQDISKAAPAFTTDFSNEFEFTTSNSAIFVIVRNNTASGESRGRWYVGIYNADESTEGAFSVERSNGTHAILNNYYGGSTFAVSEGAVCDIFVFNDWSVE